VTLYQREQMRRVFAAQLHFSELIDQVMDFVAGEFLLVSHGHHGKRNLRLCGWRRFAKQAL
jgi:hypothetical protein